jgi:hypothetical protein
VKEEEEEKGGRGGGESEMRNRIRQRTQNK